MPPRRAAGPKRDSSARGARREDQLGGQVGAEAKPDKAGAIALAEAMIRDGRMPSPEDARKRAKRAPVTTGNHVPERAADPAKQSSRHLRPRTAEEIANEQTAEQLALRIWAAMVAQKVLSGMSALMDELIQSHLLDDDDEEGDEGWLDDHHKREKNILDEAISDGLDKYLDFNAVNNLPPSSRRSTASALAGLGVAVPTIEKILAHRSGTFKGIVATYQRHSFIPEMRSALERWSEHLDRLVRGVPASKVVPIGRR
jgi:hypothetical protein